MPPVSVSTKDAPHYLWGNQCHGWHLVQHPNLSVIEERMPPDTAEVLHYHQWAHQFFYILSGQAVMEAGGKQIVLLSGQGISIPPGMRHRFRNDSTAPVTFLVISQPPSHGDRVAE